jgi:hypothetical protein
VNADNASSNDTQGETLAKMPNSFVLDHRVRCFNHTLQLSAKTLLRPFNAGLGKAPEAEDGNPNDIDDIVDSDIDDSDEGSEDGNDNDNEDHVILDMDDANDDIDELDALDEHAREKLMADTAGVREVVTKLRRLAFAIIRSTTIILPAWRQRCKDLKLKPRILPRDVVTRWNSTYYMLDFALKYRTVIDTMTADKSLKLRMFELETEEWGIVEELVTVLRLYKSATLFFSQDSASAAAVIPAMDRITNHLNHQTGKAYHPSLAAAMRLARKKLDRYYSLTDSSTIYRIAMVLHPGMKLEYFRNQKWEEDWIEEAENLVREEYVVTYEKAAKDPHAETTKAPNTNEFTSFGDLSVTTAPRPNEIQEYLSHPVNNVKDPLKWWVDNKNLYPNLHRMALDYLSVPGKCSPLSYNMIMTLICI